jgi:hypothetical protein
VSGVVRVAALATAAFVAWTVYDSTRPDVQYVVVELQRAVATCTPEEHAPTWTDWGVPGVPYKKVVLDHAQADAVHAGLESASPGEWVDCPEAPVLSSWDGKE